MSDAVQIERDGAIATVVLNAPDKLNAMSLASWRELGARMRELSADDALRCVIVRGAGTKAFAAGADIAEFPDVRANAAQGRDYGEMIHATMRSIGECRHPTVAMIHGVCVGGGLEVALMCDLRICGASSRFGIPINRLGLTMGYGELAGLLAVVGPAVAVEILLEGRVFGAQEAFDKGLVQRVVADERVEAEAREAAARIAAGAPLVARWHKEFIRRLAPSAELSDEERAEGYACFDTADFREGLAAFLAKRDPHFRGK
jgi:enoyl-CoA hydratase